MRWAVFLDRDGTINDEVEYLDRPEDLRLIPGTVQAIRLLNQAGIAAIVVTNQAGVGRDYFPETKVREIHEELMGQLAAYGVHFDAVYYCPHHPDDGCDCRKPKPGMLKRAAKEHDIALERSFAVGDKVSDLEAGRRVGCRTVLVLTGYGTEAREVFKSADFQPDHIATDLFEAVQWILSQQGYSWTKLI